MDGAKDLKIRAASAAFKSSLCELFGVPWFCPRPLDSNTQVDAARSEQQNSSSSIWSTIEKPLLWCEKLAVAGLDFILSILADYGYRPERIGWFVAITVFGSIFVFPYWLGIVGYTVEGNRDKVIPIRVLFIFDRMLPTYRIREDNYKIERYYVVPKAKDDRPKAIVRHLGKDWPVVEATDDEREKIEGYLDLLKFLGLVFTVFIIAAIGKLAR